MRYHNAIAENVAQILDRVRYIERLDEQHGPNRGRAREHAAMTWAAEELCNLYPGVVDEARSIADRKEAYRAQRGQNGSQS